MIRIRKAADRGRTRLAWLDGRHTFSFGHAYDPEWIRFGPLRVINDDRIAPGGGFGEHPHNDMEIITLMLEGQLRHKDSSGGGGVIRPGGAQRMTAGSGVTHSEFNASDSQPVHLLQIWIIPDAKGYDPEYEERTPDQLDLEGRLALVASPDGADGSMKIHQDARMWWGRLREGAAETVTVASGRRIWLQVARGDATASGAGETVSLQEGDGLGLEEATELRIAPGSGGVEVVAFDLP
ncbi:MAG: pirin family protein [Phycisphaerales bacterium JB039]